MWWLSFLFMWENWSNDSPVWGCLWWPLYDAWPMEQPRSAALWPRRLLTESIKACGAESWKPIGREEGVAWFEFCSAAPAPIHTRTAWLLTQAFTCTTLESCISCYPFSPSTCISCHPIIGIFHPLKKFWITSMAPPEDFDWSKRRCGQAENGCEGLWAKGLPLLLLLHLHHLHLILLLLLFKGLNQPPTGGLMPTWSSASSATYFQIGISGESGIFQIPSDSLKWLRFLFGHGLVVEDVVSLLANFTPFEITTTHIWVSLRLLSSRNQEDENMDQLKFLYQPVHRES